MTAPPALAFSDYPPRPPSIWPLTSLTATAIIATTIVVLAVGTRLWWLRHRSAHRRTLGRRRAGR